VEVIGKLKWVIKKLKEQIRSERQFGASGRDHRLLSEKKPNAATKRKYIQRAANQ
jgi:hypothetical protein